MQTPNRIEEVLGALRALGCHTVGLPDVGVHAIDIPESVALDAVDRLLDLLEPERVAVASPSLRHA